MKELSEGKYIWQSVWKPISVALIVFIALLAVMFWYDLGLQEIAERQGTYIEKDNGWIDVYANGDLYHFHENPKTQKMTRVISHGRTNTYIQSTMNKDEFIEVLETSGFTERKE